MGRNDNVRGEAEWLGELFGFLYERRSELELANPGISRLWSVLLAGRPAAIITAATTDIPSEHLHLPRLHGRLRKEIGPLGFHPIDLEIRCGVGLNQERLPALLVPGMKKAQAIEIGEEYSQYSIIYSDSRSVRDVPCPTEGYDIRPLVVERNGAPPTVFTMRIRELFAKFLTDNRHTRIDAVPVPPEEPYDLPLGFLVFEQVPHQTSFGDWFAQLYRKPTFIRVM